MSKLYLIYLVLPMGVIVLCLACCGSLSRMAYLATKKHGHGWAMLAAILIYLCSLAIFVVVIGSVVSMVFTR